MKKQHKAALAAIPLFGIALFATGTFAAETAKTDAAPKKAPHGQHEMRKEDKAAMDKTVAGVLGITVADLESAQKAGKSLDTLISEKGLDKATVMKALDAARKADMDAKIKADIASGKITQAQADEMAAKHTEMEAKRDASVAKALGITTTELANYKAAGKNIDNIIKEKGLDKATVEKALKADMPKGDKGEMKEKGPHGKKGEFKKEKSQKTTTATNTTTTQ